MGAQIVNFMYGTVEASQVEHTQTTTTRYLQHLQQVKIQSISTSTESIGYKHTMHITVIIQTVYKY